MKQGRDTNPREPRLVMKVRPVGNEGRLAFVLWALATSPHVTCAEPTPG